MWIPTPDYGRKKSHRLYIEKNAACLLVKQAAFFCSLYSIMLRILHVSPIHAARNVLHFPSRFLLHMQGLL